MAWLKNSASNLPCHFAHVFQTKACISGRSSQSSGNSGTGREGVVLLLCSQSCRVSCAGLVNGMDILTTSQRSSMREQAQGKSLKKSVPSCIYCWGRACSRAAWSSKGLQSCFHSSCLGTSSSFWCSVCLSSVFCIIQPLSSLLDRHKAGLYFTFQMPCWRITMIWIHNLFYHSFSLK